MSEIEARVIALQTAERHYANEPAPMWSILALAMTIERYLIFGELPSKSRMPEKAA